MGKMICCKAFEDFFYNQDIFASAITEGDDGYYITQNLEVADDGDGYVDIWRGEQKQIFYCPFCGKRLPKVEEGRRLPEVEGGE